MGSIYDVGFCSFLTAVCPLCFNLIKPSEVLLKLRADVYDPDKREPKRQTERDRKLLGTFFKD